MKRSHAPWAAVALCALMAGCATAPAPSALPAPPVPAAFPDTATGGASAPRAASELAWDSYFQDAALRRVIAAALENNRDLRVALANIALARAQFSQRDADRLPTVNATLTGSRTPTASGGISSTYAAGLAVTAWEVDFFGRVASLSEAARAQYLATEEARKAAQISLVASVAAGWLTLAADTELLGIARDTLATREESLRLTQLRFDRGAASELDLRLAQTLTESARAELARLTRQQAQDANALDLLVGRAGPANREGLPALGALSLPDVPAQTPSEVLIRRPDIRQAEQTLAAAQANIAAARAALFPRISLTAGVGTASSQLENLFSGGSWGFTLAPSLLLPIFDAGRNDAALLAAQASRDVAVAQYEKAIQAGFREVADALAARATVGEQLAAQSRGLQAETARLRLVQLRHDNGVASALDLLDAQRSLYTARVAVVQTRLLQLQSQVQLYKALGGGWKD